MRCSSAFPVAVAQGVGSTLVASHWDGAGWWRVPLSARVAHKEPARARLQIQVTCSVCLLWNGRNVRGTLTKGARNDWWCCRVVSLGFATKSCSPLLCFPLTLAKSVTSDQAVTTEKLEICKLQALMLSLGENKFSHKNRGSPRRLFLIGLILRHL